MARADSNRDLARLQAELEQEKEDKEMLEESVSDLRSTLVDLEERLHSVEGEGNEWRTRYETQVELNEQLERHIRVVQERIERLRAKPLDRLAPIRSYEDMTLDALRHRLQVLSTEKNSLQNQLLECRLRIDHEDKAYQKAYDERRAYLTEIAKVTSTCNLTKKQQQPQKVALQEKRAQRSVKQGLVLRRGPVQAELSQSRWPRLKQ